MLPYIYPFGIRVSMYMVMATISLIAQITINIAWRDKMGFSKQKAALMAMCFALFGFAGTKAIFIFTEFDAFIEHLFHFTKFTVYGAILLLPIAVLWFYRFFNCEYWHMMDMAAYSILVSTSIWNVGCLCAGCCAGKYIDIMGYSFQFPSQLFDIAISLLIIYILVSMEKTKKGKLYPLFMILFGIFRFFIEFFRGQNPTLWILNKWQLYAIVTFAIGIIVYLYLQYMELDKKINSYVDKFGLQHFK